MGDLTLKDYEIIERAIEEGVYRALIKESEEKYERRKKVFKILRESVKRRYRIDVCDLLARTFYEGLEKKLLPCLEKGDIDHARTIYNKVVWCLGRIVHYCEEEDVGTIEKMGRRFPIKEHEELKTLLQKSLEEWGRYKKESKEE